MDAAADFDFFWTTIDREYAYAGTRGADWACVKRVYGPEAAAATDADALLQVLEHAIDALAEPHANLNRNLQSSYRLVPSGLDVAADWVDGRAVIVQVRPGSSAEQAGVLPGQVVLAIDGLPAADAADARLGPCIDHADPDARAWALASALADRHDTERVWTIDGVGDVRPDAFAAIPLPAVDHRRFGDDLGWITIRNVGDTASVKEFDRALADLRDTRGLVIDLSDTAAGGDTDVAEPILGRLVDERVAYQRGQPVHGDPWTREIVPRKWTYTAPIVVLVSRWTGSMGEGMAMGLDGAHRAVIVGSPMAGLRGAVHTFLLPSSGIPFTFPAERVFHVDGTPREDWRPPVALPPETRAADVAAAEGELTRITR
jgi:C-terminal processing protease CtpA/Prc